MKVTFPTSSHISPGRIRIDTRREVVTESWMFGELVETREVINESFDVDVPCPPDHEDPDIVLMGSFTFADRTWTVVRDDDEAYWGVDRMVIDPSKNPDDPRNQMIGIFRGGKAEWMERQRAKLRITAAALAEDLGWELEEDGISPKAPAQTFSRAALEAERKTTMAHVLALIGVFKSVNDAKRNGWDKPLELGEFCVTKKKIRFRITE